MTTSAFHIVALANALLLALPAGWCNQLGRPEQNATTPVQAFCCHPASSNPQSSIPRPTTPTLKCCCSQAVVAPEKVVKQADNLVGQALPLFLADFGGAAGDSLFATAGDSSSAGLRLHALLCVWRC